MPLWHEAARGEGAATGFARAAIGCVNAGCAPPGVAAKVTPRKTRKAGKNRVAEIIRMRGPIEPE
jgi:hypothetical protein